MIETSPQRKQHQQATAVILALRDTGMRMNDQLWLELVLDVLPTDRPPFRATARTIISQLQIAQVQPGRQVLVRYAPADPSQVIVAGMAGQPAR